MRDAQNAATSQPHPTPLMLTRAAELEQQAAAASGIGAVFEKPRTVRLLC